MRINRLAVECVVVALLFIVTVVNSLQAASHAPPNVGNQAPDSTTVERLTRDRLNANLTGLDSTTAISDTAAILAAELLMTPINFNVDLPLVIK